MRRPVKRGIGFWILWLGLVTAAAPACAEEPAGEAAGGGQLTREQEKPIAHLCAGCVTPMFTDGSKGTITPYGRIELDGIYSSRNTNTNTNSSKN